MLLNNVDEFGIHNIITKHNVISTFSENSINIGYFRAICCMPQIGINS